MLMGLLRDCRVRNYSIFRIAVIEAVAVLMELPQREGEQRQTLVTPHNRPASATPVVPPINPPSIRT